MWIICSVVLSHVIPKTNIIIKQNYYNVITGMCTNYNTAGDGNPTHLDLKW